MTSIERDPKWVGSFVVLTGEIGKVLEVVKGESWKVQTLWGQVFESRYPYAQLITAEQAEWAKTMHSLILDLPVGGSIKEIEFPDFPGRNRVSRIDVVYGEIPYIHIELGPLHFRAGIGEDHGFGKIYFDLPKPKLIKVWDWGKEMVVLRPIRNPSIYWKEAQLNARVLPWGWVEEFSPAQVQTAGTVGDGTFSYPWGKKFSGEVPNTPGSAKKIAESWAPEVEAMLKSE